jgi:hypothetical protein
VAYIKTAIPGRRQIMVRGQVSLDPVTITALITGGIKLGGFILGKLGVFRQWHWTDFRRELVQQITSQGLGNYVSSADLVNATYGPVIKTTQSDKIKRSLDRNPKYAYVGQSKRGFTTTWNYFSNFYLQQLIKTKVIAKAKSDCQMQGNTWTGEACVPKENGNGGPSDPGFTTAGILGKGIAFTIAGMVVYFGYQFFTKDKKEEA